MLQVQSFSQEWVPNKAYESVNSYEAHNHSGHYDLADDKHATDVTRNSGLPHNGHIHNCTLLYIMKNKNHYQIDNYE